MIFENLHNLRRRIEDFKREAELAERSGNLEKVAEIIYGNLPQAEKEYQSYEKKNFGKKTSKKKNEDKSFIKEMVDEEDIAGVVSRWTGIPVSRMLETESEKLSKIEEVLKKITEAPLQFKNFAESGSRQELIVLFLAILHLIKDQLIEVDQKSNFHEMTIAKKV